MSLHPFLLLASTLAVVLSACGGSGTTQADDPADNRIDVSDRSGPRRSAVPGDEDDDDDDGITVAGIKGKLDPYDIQKGVQPHARKINSCFVSGIGRRRYIGGDIELKYIVNRDGTVKQVQVAKSDIGAWEVEKCLIGVGKRMTFRPPRGRAEAEFSLPLSFKGRGTVPYWDEDRADKEVGKKLSELEACAAESGAAEPQNIWVTVYVGNRGAVKSVGFASPSKKPIESAWADCAMGKVSAWQLSDPRGRVAKMTFRFNPE